MNERTRAILCVAFGAGLLGFAPIGLRLSEVGPQATAFWRFIFALPVILALAAQTGPTERAATLRHTPALLLAGVLFGLDIAFWHASLTLTTVANATLLSNMTPILAAVAGLILFKELIGRAFWVGAPIALAGAGLLTFARSQAGQGAHGYSGEIIALVSAVWYAAYLIMVSRYRREIPVWPLMAVTTIAAAGLALAAALFTGEALWPQTGTGWAILVGLGVVVHAGGQGFIAMGLGRLPIALSTVVLWVQPVAAAGLSWALFHESLGPLALLGGGLVLGGVYIVQRARA
jgi:drug/metabolite transporter (DMT)-like permease